MDNVSNHEYPSENCFEDAYWSVLNGKFYSNLACENRGKPSPTPPPTRPPTRPTIDPRITERTDIRDQSPTPPPTPTPPPRNPTDQNPPTAAGRYFIINTIRKISNNCLEKS